MPIFSILSLTAHGLTYEQISAENFKSPLFEMKYSEVKTFKVLKIDVSRP